MAPAFGRSISFPMSPSRSSSSTKQSRHVRSISLPTSHRSHPQLAHLHATTLAARAWSAAAAADPCCTTTSPSSGLAHLDALHAAITDLLHLPEPRAALATSTAFSDRLLDALLSLADAHGAFREALLDLRRHAAEARAALRRRDAPRLASAVRALRRQDKDLARLASSSARATTATATCRLSVHLPVAPGADAEVAAVLADALAAAAHASAAVFSALEAVSSAATNAAAAAASSSRKPAAALVSLVTRSSKAVASDEDRELAAAEKMERLDNCVAEMEAGSDKVFRSILHARVALLNIRTQTC